MLRKTQDKFCKLGKRKKILALLIIAAVLNGLNIVTVLISRSTEEAKESSSTIYVPAQAYKPEREDTLLENFLSSCPPAEPPENLVLSDGTSAFDCIRTYDTAFLKENPWIEELENFYTKSRSAEEPKNNSEK